MVGLGDALLVTSDMWHFGSDVQKATLLDILIFALDSGSVRLRHIAIRVAYNNRDALSATENTQHAEMGEKLLTTFSQVLMTSISLDIVSANGASDNDQGPARWEPNDDSDLYFHDERDRRYLELIFTFANSSDWVPSIVRDGHLDRCLLLLRRGRSDALHLAVIFLRIEADKRVDTAHLNTIAEEQWRKVTYWAWPYLRDWDTLKDCIDTLHALAECTIEYLSSDSQDLPWLRSMVVEVLGHLKRVGVREESCSAVGTLLKAIDERQREES